MNISGFHFALTVTDLADYDYVEELEHENLLVLICSTWTEGIPPPTAKGFYDYVEVRREGGRKEGLGRERERSVSNVSFFSYLPPSLPPSFFRMSARTSVMVARR